GILEGWVADATRSTTHQNNRSMAMALEQGQTHDLDIISNRQGGSRGVKSNISLCLISCQILFQSRRHVVDHPAPSEFFDKIHPIFFPISKIETIISIIRQNLINSPNCMRFL